MAGQINSPHKRLRLEMLAPEETGIQGLQREIMELKQENKRLRRDICKALPEVVHEMRNIVGQLQVFAKTMQTTCNQLTQTCQRFPPRDGFNRRTVTPTNANRMPQKHKLVKKIGPGQPPIRTVKTVEKVANSPQMQHPQRQVQTKPTNHHFSSGSPTITTSSPRYSPSAKQSPGTGSFSPAQVNQQHTATSPRTPRYPPSTANPVLPVPTSDTNVQVVVTNVTSLSKNAFDAPVSQAPSAPAPAPAPAPVPVQLNSSKPGEKQDVFELQPGSGVCIPIQSWISMKMQCGNSESKMVRQLMKMLFSEEELSSSLMRGNRAGQKSLDQSKVEAIIWRCMEEFPGRTKGHIGQAISQKLQEARKKNQKRPLSTGSGGSSDSGQLDDDILMLLDQAQGGDLGIQQDGSTTEGSNGQQSKNDDDVIMVKEDDAGWR